jgi:hypothetical protein
MALTDSLVAYWKMDGNSNDSVDSHNGTDTAMSYSTGKIGQAAIFNGGTSKILVPDHVDWSMAASGFSISCWIKRGATGTVQSVLGQLNAAGNNSSISFGIFINATNNVVGRVAIGSTIYNVTSTGTISDTTTWHHLGFVRDGTSLRMYIDGVADGVTNSVIGSINNSTTNLGIGASGDFIGSYWNGGIDEVGIWKARTLSAGEIGQIYNYGQGITYPFGTGKFFFMF